MASDVVSLREYIEQRIEAMAALSRERLDGIHREQAQRDKAIETAFADSERWRANANEWRSTLSDRDKMFATMVALDAVEAQVRALQNSNERAAGITTERQRQAERRQWLIGMGFSGLTVLFSWLVNR